MPHTIRLTVMLILLSAACIAAADAPAPSNAAAPTAADSAASRVSDRDKSKAAPPSAAAATPAAVKEGDADSEGKPGLRRRTGLTPDPNRHWIMKQPKYENRKSEWKSDKTVAWEGAAQELRCREYEKGLIQEYKNARYYSIQGDRCKTAHYSAKFLTIVEKCKSGCPETFLESTGFDPHFIRNMRQLKRLGSESCLDQSSPSAAPAAEK